MEDYYKILEISESASDKEISSAFRKLAKKYHPDMNKNDPTAEAKFKKISKAHEVLSNKQLKEEYDLSRHMKSNFFTGGKSFNFNQGNQPFIDLNTLFREFSGGFQNPEPKNASINAQYAITLEEAYFGVSKTIDFTLPEGTNQSLSINLPEGIRDGTRLLYKGMGSKKFTNIAAGDLVITVKIKPHPLFENHGSDLLTITKIDAFDAILGTSLKIKTIDGSFIKVTVPSGVQYNHTLRIKDKGMPIPNSKEKGNLYIKLQITMPNKNKLSKKQLDLLKTIKQLKSSPEVTYGVNKEI